VDRVATVTLWVASIGFAASVAAEVAHADDLVIRSARVRGTRIHLTVGNQGATTSGALSVTLTTRAGGFMVGTAAHPLPILSPGSSHDSVLPLPIWAPGRSDLLSVITQRGCCTTRVVLLPAEIAVEVSHLLPLPLPSDGAAPPASEESP
jgi:hypothetical protein